MLKLLIADDEVYTREGILEQMLWSNYGITEIKQAYDGVNALEIATSYKPDILLTDVRMPRMDGIELSFKLREKYPECQIIFLSGYSDKEYLKSAIKLKAISYVEKPIDLDELDAALKSAAELLSKKSLNNEKALQLINGNIDKNKLSSFFPNTYLEALTETCFLSAFIKILDYDSSMKENIINHVTNVASNFDYNSFCAFTDNNLLLIHLYWPEKKHLLSMDENIHELFSTVSQYLNQTSKFFIAVGNQCTGIDNIMASYDSALQALKKSFFYDYNSIITFNTINSKAFQLNEKIFASFSQYLSEKNKLECILFIKRLTSDIKACSNTDINIIKDLYYRLYIELLNFSNDISYSLNINTNAFDYFSNSLNIYDLEAYLIEKIELIFKFLKEKNDASNPIDKIVRFVIDNYADVDLSLDKISEKTYLTTAYICVIFKEQTGKTINKFITEFRVDKAKELLKDSSIKINDIAAKVGYNDGNYFSKIFRKETGLTPSEYRKKFFL